MTGEAGLEGCALSLAGPRSGLPQVDLAIGNADAASEGARLGQDGCGGRCKAESKSKALGNASECLRPAAYTGWRSRARLAPPRRGTQHCRLLKQLLIIMEQQ